MIVGTLIIMAVVLGFDYIDTVYDTGHERLSPLARFVYVPLIALAYFHVLWAFNLRGPTVRADELDPALRGRVVSGEGEGRRESVE
jgi:hypothetical protein